MSRDYSGPALMIVMACAFLSPVRRAAAQEYLSALALPPASVGTCVPSSARVTEHRLVMVSEVPGKRREIMTVTDSAGRPVGYQELTFDFAPPAGGKAVDVLASLTPAGVIQGVITRREVTMTPPAPGTRIDSASMRAMNESAKTRNARTALDTNQRAKVLQLARWLVRRCPA